LSKENSINQERITEVTEVEEEEENVDE